MISACKTVTRVRVVCDKPAVGNIRTMSANCIIKNYLENCCEKDVGNISVC